MHTITQQNPNNFEIIQKRKECKYTLNLVTQLWCYFDSSSFITNHIRAVQQSNDTSTTIHDKFVANYDNHSLHITTIIANHDETHYIY